jgi:hypothetical protein
MSNTESNATLLQAMKELSVQWQQTKGFWRDVKADEFEKKYLDGFPNLVARTSTAIDEITALLRKVQIDCE